MVHSHLVRDMDKHFIIDPIARTVTNAESKKTLLMQNDHNSERFSFEIDKFVEGHDMTLCNKVEVHYVNIDVNKKDSNPGVYEVDDVEVNPDDPNKLIFTWLVSQNATMYNGMLLFNMVFACVENGEVTYRWCSGMNNSIAIAKGLNNGEVIADTYPDILVKWKNDLHAAVYGMVDVHVGPTEPEAYPYIWFDTSAYVGVPDKNIAMLTIKDAEGIKQTLYPTTILAATDQAEINTRLDDLFEQLGDVPHKLNELEERFNESINNLQNGKVDKDKVANNLTTIEEGWVLDARQGYELKMLTNTKAVVAGYNAVLPASGWSDSAPYTQTVAVEGILETDNPFVDVDMSSATDTLATIESWNFINRITANNGSITAVAYEDVPTVDLSILLRVVK